MKLFRFMLMCVLVLALFVPAAAQTYYRDGVRLSSTQISRLQRPDEVSTVQNYSIGSKLQIGDRVFYYAKLGPNTGNGADTEYGLAVVSNVTQTLATGASSPGVAASDSASTTAKLILTGATADQYADGFWYFRDASDHKSWVTQISTNTAAATGDTVTFTLVDDLPAALTASDTVIIIPNQYSNVVVPSATNFYSSVVGMICFYNPAGTDYENYYTWIQTWGPYNATLATAAGGVKGERQLYHKGGGQVAIPDSLGIMWQGGAADSLYAGALEPVGSLIARGSAATDPTYPFMYLTIKQ